MRKIQLILHRLTIFLVILFPIAILHFNHGGSTTFFLLVLLGICTPHLQRYRPFSKDEKKLFMVLGLFFGLALLSIIINGINRQNVSEIEVFGKFLFAIPFSYLLLRIKPKQHWLWIGLVSGSLLSGILGLFEAITHGFPPTYRVQGSTHPIIYGDLSMAMAFMSLGGIKYFTQKNKWMILLPLIAFSCGLTGSVLSGTRGAWLALPALCFLLIWYYWKILNNLQRIVIVISILTIPTLLYFIPQTGIQKKINDARQDIIAFQEKQDEITSVGARLGMWQVAWNIFIDNPFVGIGPGVYTKAAQKFVDAGIHQEGVTRGNHPHNEFLNVLCTRGLFGFIGLLVLFWVPIKYFYVNMIKEDQTLSSFGLTGIILLVSYLHFGLTEAILYRSPPILFFTFYLTLVTYHISSLSKKESDLNE